MRAETYKGGVLSFRNDRMGARLLALLNAIRIAQDYDLPYFVAWKTDGRTSEELQNPTEIFDATYFKQRSIPLEDYQRVSKNFLDLLTLPPDATANVIEHAAQSGTVMHCHASSLVTLPWEDAADVAPRYAAAISALRFSPDVTAAMAHVDAKLKGKGTAFHIRRGDIIHDPITSNQLWSNKFIPREFYEVLAKRLLADPDRQILVFSDEPAEIDRLKALGPQIISPSEVVPSTLTLAQRDFIELYAMSRCREIFGPPNSGFSIAAALIGNRPIHDVRQALTKPENVAALDLLVDRLRNHPDMFLGDGDAGQNFPFAVDHLNNTRRSDAALDLLETYAARGFCKAYFFKLHIKQKIIAGDYTATPVVAQMASAPMDTMMPGRIELHWSEVYRMAAIANAHAGNVEKATHDITLSLSYSGTNRPAIMTLSQMWSAGMVDPDTFPLPFDGDAKRPLAPATMAFTAAREGHGALLVPGRIDAQFAMPPELITYDWSDFMGKFLMRTFGRPDTTPRAAALFESQFAKHMPDASLASTRALYAHFSDKKAEALALHEQAVTLAPDNPLYLKRMAMTGLQVEPDNKKWRRALKRAAEIGGKNSLYQGAVALMFWEVGRKNKAINLMQELCEAPFVLPEVLFVTARMIRQHKDTTEEALAYIDRAMTLAPHVRRYMTLHSNMLISLKKHDDAMAAIDMIMARFGATDDLAKLRKRAET